MGEWRRSDRLCCHAFFAWVEITPSARNFHFTPTQSIFFAAFPQKDYGASLRVVLALYQRAMCRRRHNPDNRTRDGVADQAPIKAASYLTAMKGDAGGSKGRRLAPKEQTGPTRGRGHTRQGKRLLSPKEQYSCLHINSKLKRLSATYYEKQEAR